MLTFISTMSLSDFKAMKKATALEMRHNSETGKDSFVCGDTDGAVSQYYVESGDNPSMISLVEDRDTGESFFLLHNRHRKTTKSKTL